MCSRRLAYCSTTKSSARRQTRIWNLAGRYEPFRNYGTPANALCGHAVQCAQPAVHLPPDICRNKTPALWPQRAPYWREVSFTYPDRGHPGAIGPGPPTEIVLIRTSQYRLVKSLARNAVMVREPQRNRSSLAVANAALGLRRGPHGNGDHG